MTWFHINKKKPPCDKKPDSFGTSVLVYEKGEVKQAFYGCRQTLEPNFYLYGAVLEVDWWMPMPEVPREQKLLSPSNDPPSPWPWRTGSKNPRVIYNLDDEMIGSMDTPELAQFVVLAVNRHNEK